MWTCSFLDISASVPWGVYGRKGRGKWAINQSVAVFFMRQPCPAKYPVMAGWTMASRVKVLPKGPRSANMNQQRAGPDPPMLGFTGELSTYWATSPHWVCSLSVTVPESSTALHREITVQFTPTVMTWSGDLTSAHTATMTWPQLFTAENSCSDIVALHSYPGWHIHTQADTCPGVCGWLWCHDDTQHPLAASSMLCAVLV